MPCCLHKEYGAQICFCFKSGYAYHIVSGIKYQKYYCGNVLFAYWHYLVSVHIIDRHYLRVFSKASMILGLSSAMVPAM